MWGEGIQEISITLFLPNLPHYKESSQGTIQAPTISISAAGDPADSGTLGPLRLRASQPETRKVFGFRVCGLVFRVYGLGLWGSGSGCGVWPLHFQSWGFAKLTFGVRFRA